MTAKVKRAAIHGCRVVYAVIHGRESQKAAIHGCTFHQEQASH
jgi:hypothetical protein